MDLRHYDEKPIDDFDYQPTFIQSPPRNYRKPRGFWVSVKGDDDWPSWCISENFHIKGLAAEHEVKLRSDANILVLPDVESMDRFTAQYGIVTPQSYVGESWNNVSIDWMKVASEYDGIIITPYHWERRLVLDWYYGWDCASGCIWEMSAIESVTHVASTMKALPE